MDLHRIGARALARRIKQKAITAEAACRAAGSSASRAARAARRSSALRATSGASESGEVGCGAT